MLCLIFHMICFQWQSMSLKIHHFVDSTEIVRIATLWLLATKTQKCTSQTLIKASLERWVNWNTETTTLWVAYWNALRSIFPWPKCIINQLRIMATLHPSSHKVKPVTTSASARMEFEDCGWDVGILLEYVSWHFTQHFQGSWLDVPSKVWCTRDKVVC